MSAHPLANLSESKFIELVSNALKNYQNLSQLWHSPLANSPLLEPALVLDKSTPTADERGRALRIILCWACNRLAPTPPRYPIGMARPFDDPTWRDPIWWRYNILRHRYINPLQQSDLESLGCNRVTDALTNLTGIPGRGGLFDERNRAIHDLAILLQRQLLNRQCDTELRQMAMDELYCSLETCDMAQDLLGLAATFHTVFPKSLLLEMACEKKVQNPHRVLNYLVTRRFLLPGNADDELLVPFVLQEYIYARQPKPDLIQQHERAAQFFLQNAQAIESAWHLMMSEHPIDAANILLEAAPTCVQKQDLRQALAKFTSKQLPAFLWCQVQILLSDLWVQAEQRDKALNACRQAFGMVTDLYQQAQIYRRMGKLYQDQNVMQALRYYQLAADLLEPADPDYLILLQDRAQLYAQRNEWKKAEADLKLALLQLESSAPQQQLNIHNALSRLYYQQKLYDNVPLPRKKEQEKSRNSTEYDLLPEEKAALEIAQRDGQVTTQTLIQHTGGSKSTAKRKLAGLVERGLLLQKGKGRATYYCLPET